MCAPTQPGLTAVSRRAYNALNPQVVLGRVRGNSVGPLHPFGAGAAGPHAGAAGLPLQKEDGLPQGSCSDNGTEIKYV